MPIRPGTPCAALAIGLLLAGCAAADVPRHHGYKSAKSRPWQKPTVVEFDSSYEAELDDSISYPNRQRARWYAVDLPGWGGLEVQLTVASLIDDTDVDVAFEIMNEGYETIERADRDEDDAGDDQKVRRIDSLAPGRYYIHVWAQNRMDEADYTLQVVYFGGEEKYESDFPASVAYVGALPDIPAVDDAPSRPPRRSPPRKRPTKRDPDPEPQTKTVRARIAAITAQGGRTQIRIDRGSTQGVEIGWKGAVIDRSGKSISGGSFQITRVTASESFATVSAKADAVTAAKWVRLSPP